jgi:type IV secretion system protein VirD4
VVNTVSKEIQIGLFAVFAVAVFGLISSVALAISVGAPLGDVTPWWIAIYVGHVGVTPAVTKAATAGTIAVGLTPLLWLFRVPQTDLGRARFARRGEVRRARLLASSGILLGKFGAEFLRNDEPLHVLVAAPTRSGKGVGIVVPNLLNWPGSAIVLDIKYENFSLTSGFRAAHGQRVFRFSPTDSEGRSHRYNPLDAVRRGRAQRISDLQRLAAILLPAPATARDPFWQDEARSLFLGLALFLLDTPELPTTLGEIHRTLMGPLPLEAFCRSAVETREDLDPICVQALGSFANKAEKERSGVRSTLTAALQLWANPMIDAATSASDFDLRDLRRIPTTIYVAVSLDQLPSVSRLLNLFFQQAVSLLAERTPEPDERHRVLVLLDEFASLGRMDVLKDSLAFLAGYGVRICTIVQGLSQLDGLYGREEREGIVQNSAIQLFFAPNDQTTARYVSEQLGTRTIRTVTRTSPRGGRLESRTYGETRRALLLPEEVRQLGSEEVIVFKEGVPPVRGSKIRYYRDRRFSERCLREKVPPRLDVQR